MFKLEGKTMPGIRSCRSVLTYAVVVAGSAFLGGAFAQDAATFANPVIARSADPSVVFVEGIYYSVQSGCTHSGTNPVICIRAARALTELGRVVAIPVWSAPASGPNAHDVWAPEIENFDGKWYIYYAADPDENPHHGLFALVPRNNAEPMGAWTEANTGTPSGSLQLDWKSAWAIDPSVFKASDGNLYLLFACRQDNTDQNPGRFQSICISAMSDPLHLETNPLTGKKVVELSLPTQAWEKRGFPTEEGPFGFTRNGKDYVLYSASFSGTADQYAEGLLINSHPPQPMNRGNPLLNPASWIKEGPVFDGHHAAYGTASGVLVSSLDHTELWHVYHGTDCLDGCRLVNNKTWADRSVRAQSAAWSASDDLILGYPADIQNTDGHGRPVPLPAPSTHGYGSLTPPPWGSAFGDAAEGSPADGQPVGDWADAASASIRLASADPDRLDRTFFASNPNFQNYVVYAKTKLAERGHAGSPSRFGIIGAYVDHANYFLAMIEPQGCGNLSCLSTQAFVQGKEAGWLRCTLPVGFDPNSLNTLAIEAVGGSFQILVNDIAVEGPCQGRHFQLSAGQLSQNGSNGQVGLAGQNAKADFSSFMVSPGVPVDTRQSGELFAFRSVRSQMQLDVACGDCRNEKTNDSAAIVQRPPAAPYPLTAWPGQLWQLEKNGGSFRIVNSLTHMCLSAATQTGQTSVALVEQRCANGNNQRWSFLPVPSRSSFIIANQATLQVLEVDTDQRLAPVKLSPRQDSSSQIWQLLTP
jgi:GH43 family beta-xylosidase